MFIVILGVISTITLNAVYMINVRNESNNNKTITLPCDGVVGLVVVKSVNIVKIH